MAAEGGQFACPYPTALAELQAPRRTNQLAILSLVFSVLMALPGIVMGHVALSQIRRTGEEGRGLAIAGLIVGYVFLVIGIAGGLVYMLYFSAFYAMLGGY